MSPELQPQQSFENEPYGFTEHERLFERISHKHLLSILENPMTDILKTEVSSNVFGEFLFVTTKRMASQQAVHITFWGLGFHEFRERWLQDEWFWYETTPPPFDAQERLTREQALTRINERHAEIMVSPHPARSSRSKLYEMLADLTDEDGALVRRMATWEIAS
ncbi:MAG: hypothetical protein R3E39_26445 [Anaerolineae bacterium]